jgi:hypothetical protein
MPRQPTLLPTLQPRAAEPMAAETVLEAVDPVLQPLIQLLLHSGVDYPRFAAALKPWFIEQAKAELLRAGQGVTDSSLSLRSGIHRKDVRSWRENRLADKTRRDVGISAQVYARWTSDPDYRDRRRQPRALNRTGDSPSFESLVRSVTQDLHPFTVLQELIRLGLAAVEIRKGQEIVVANGAGFVPAPGSREALELLGANLADHALAAVNNVLGEQPRLEQSVFAAGITPQSADALGALARRLWSHARSELIAQATRLYEADKDKPEATARMRFGSYFWSEDWQQPAPGAAPDPQETPQ